MKKKVLLYAMTGEKSCFMHVLLNALDLDAGGHEVRVIFEGASVRLPARLSEEKNPGYLQARDRGLIAGICLACSRVMGVLEQNQALGLPMLDDMMGHAGFRRYLEEGWEVVSI